MLPLIPLAFAFTSYTSSRSIFYVNKVQSSSNKAAMLLAFSANIAVGEMLNSVCKWPQIFVLGKTKDKICHIFVH